MAQEKHDVLQAAPSTRGARLVEAAEAARKTEALCPGAEKGAASRKSSEAWLHWLVNRRLGGGCATPSSPWRDLQGWLGSVGALLQRGYAAT